MKEIVEVFHRDSWIHRSEAKARPMNDPFCYYFQGKIDWFFIGWVEEEITTRNRVSKLCLK